MSPINMYKKGASSTRATTASKSLDREASANVELRGVIDRIIFSTEDGYHVVAATQTEGGSGQSFRMTLRGFDVQAGLEFTANGTWRTHPKYGKQFNAVHAIFQTPQYEAGLLKYLGSGAIKGVGPELAKRLIDQFGNHVFEMVEDDPLVLEQVPGIGKKKARVISASLIDQRQVRDLMVMLRGLGVGEYISRRIYEKYGDRAIELVKKDPYRLVPDVEGIGFQTADSIAAALGVPHEGSTRIEAGCFHLLHEAASAGHTLVPKDQLIERSETFLEVSGGVAEAIVSLEARQLVRFCAYGYGDVAIGLRKYVDAESRIASNLRAALDRQPQSRGKRSDLNRNDPNNNHPNNNLGLDLDTIRNASDVSLSTQQEDALLRSLYEAVSVITGGPGTGKTTLLRALVAALKSSGKKVLLVAPTGRAAKRLSQVSGEPASTIHRLLKFRNGDFFHNRDNPLPKGTLIVDEASMLDVIIMDRLVEALPKHGGQLILVGDVNQLPSVGAGNVLANMIQSGVIPVSRLSEIYRQATESAIVRSAHRILVGQAPVGSAKGDRQPGGVHIISVDSAKVAGDRIVDLCQKQIPSAYGFDPVDDIQVLSPMHRGDAGTAEINRRLQLALNKNTTPSDMPRLFVGDKVMQTRNNYDQDVYNGDIGTIESIDSRSGMMRVAINDGIVEYTRDSQRQLTLAYCMSIHKSQGSEYPAVVIPLVTQHYMMLRRDIFYTALTRAKQLVVLLAHPKALRIAVSRDDDQHRMTWLLELLKGDAHS